MERAGAFGLAMEGEVPDRLGERAVTRGGDGALLETFAVCRDLSDSPEFCAAVAAAAVPARKPARGLAHVVGIDPPHEPGGHLLVHQEPIAGERLSDVAARRRRQGKAFGLAHGLFVLRECAGALRALHARGACHGAISIHRVLLTADDRVLLCEPVLGPGLAAMSRPRDWFVETLGLAVPLVPGVPTFTPLTDQLQLGRLVLELLAGAPPAPTPSSLRQQLDELVVAGPDGSAQPLADPWRTLLGRMLLLAPEGPFRSMAALEQAVGLALAEPGGVDPGPPPIEAGDLAPSMETGPRLASAPAPVAPAANAQTAALHLADTPAGSARPDTRRSETVAPALRIVDTTSAAAPAVEAGRGGTVTERCAPHPTPVPSGDGLDEYRRSGVGQAEGASIGLATPVRDAGSHRISLEQAMSLTGYGDEFRPEQVARPSFGPRHPAGRASTRASRAWLKVAGAVVGLALAAGAGWYLWSAWTSAGPAPPGWLHLESKPAGATVSVNGEPKGQTPLTLSLPAGAYAVEFALEGETRALTVPVTAQGEAFQLVSLYPPGPPGTVVVASMPAGGLVSLDGTQRGRAPLVLRDVAPGEHLVRVENGVASVERQVEILAGANVELFVPLSGAVVVESPFEVTVTEGDTTVGRSTAGALAVRAGTRRFTFSNAGLNYEETREVEVPAGSVARVTLEPPTGVINFDADVTAQVFLDGHPLGLTPLSSIKVSLGTHEVLFREAYGAEVRYVIVVALGPAYRLKATLQGKAPPRSSRRR